MSLAHKSAISKAEREKVGTLIRLTNAFIVCFQELLNSFFSRNLLGCTTLSTCSKHTFEVACLKAIKLNVCLHFGKYIGTFFQHYAFALCCTVTSLGGTQSLVLDFYYDQIKREQTSSQNNNEYGAKVRFYPEAKYFVEAGYIVNNGDYAYRTGKTLVVGAGYAFTPRLAVLLSTYKFDGDVSTEQSSETSTTLTVGYRF